MNDEEPKTTLIKGSYVTKKGLPESFTPRINGRMFRCKCECNVFSKPNDQNLDLYECNSCGELYRAD